MIERHLKGQVEALNNLIRKINLISLNKLLDDMELTIKNGRKIIATALGKNVPICEKFIGTLISVGIPGYFLHTNSAVHGDLGAIQDGDLIIMLTKSGETEESVYLFEHLVKRNVKFWLLTYSPNSYLANKSPNKLVLYLEHEGDKWNLVPNNSSIGFLLILQAIAMELIDRLNINIEVFAKNHPGGYIGKVLQKISGGKDYV